MVGYGKSAVDGGIFCNRRIFDSLKIPTSMEREYLGIDAPVAFFKDNHIIQPMKISHVEFRSILPTNTA